MQQAPLTQIWWEGDFIKELEDALLDESIDLAGAQRQGYSYRSAAGIELSGSVSGATTSAIV